MFKTMVNTKAQMFKNSRGGLFWGGGLLSFSSRVRSPHYSKNLLFGTFYGIQFCPTGSKIYQYTSVYQFSVFSTHRNSAFFVQTFRKLFFGMFFFFSKYACSSVNFFLIGSLWFLRQLENLFYRSKKVIKIFEKKIENHIPPPSRKC